MKKPSYGIDAPKVVRNLFLFAFLALVILVLSFQIESPFWFWIVLLYALTTFVSLVGSGCWMLYGTKIAKFQIAHQMIEELNLMGDELVLDLGCGRGLLLMETAKRLSNGKAYGIDLWQTKDQSGNKLDAVLENARCEGVEDRVSIQTGDIRDLPFPDQTFDAVVSNLVIHNISDQCGREKALSEMIRVLKPRGKFILGDIHHTKTYAEFLMDHGAVDVTCSKPNYSYCPPIRIVTGRKK